MIGPICSEQTSTDFRHHLLNVSIPPVLLILPVGQSTQSIASFPHRVSLGEIIPRSLLLSLVCSSLCFLTWLYRSSTDIIYPVRFGARKKKERRTPAASRRADCTDSERLISGSWSFRSSDPSTRDSAALFFLYERKLASLSTRSLQLYILFRKIIFSL